MFKSIVFQHKNISLTYPQTALQSPVPVIFATARVTSVPGTQLRLLLTSVQEVVYYEHIKKVIPSNHWNERQMNTTEYYIPDKGPEDFYAYRLGLQVQAYGGAFIIVLGVVGKQNI